MSQDSLGLLKHLKTARARWPFPDAEQRRVTAIKDSGGDLAVSLCLVGVAVQASSLEGFDDRNSSSIHMLPQVDHLAPLVVLGMIEKSWKPGFRFPISGI